MLSVLAEQLFAVLALLACADDDGIEEEAGVDGEATLLATVDAEIPEIIVVVGETTATSVAITVTVDTDTDTDIVDVFFSSGANLFRPPKRLRTLPHP
ncbi:hypothetical protein CPC08DRAFT_704822 [Agrocybe pediades]|nr:hypothetical protein CPC08DRAFT_704822 [Agrocybe pediades]